MGTVSVFLDTYIYCSTVKEQKKRVYCFRTAGNGFSLIFSSWLSISEQVADVDFFVGC
jgi:hypothetical protein